MAYAPLVVSDLTAEFIQSGDQFLSELDAINIPITAAFWLLRDEDSYWELVLSSAEVDQLGPRAFYSKVGDCLRSSRIEGLNLSHIKAVSTDDPIVTRLRRVLGNVHGQIRFTGNVIDGVLIPDALVYRLA